MSKPVGWDAKPAGVFTSIKKKDSRGPGFKGSSDAIGVIAVNIKWVHCKSIAVQLLDLLTPKILEPFA